MVRKVALVVVLSLCLGSLAGVAFAGPKFTPGSPGLGDPYFPLDGNGGYDVEHYLLDVTYDPASDPRLLTGEATIKARATQDLSEFNLDFVGLEVRSIEVAGKEAKWRRTGDELTVTPKSGLHRGKHFTIEIRYDGVPEPIIDPFGVSGFFHTDDGALVVGQPHVAATWFPANDHPRDKAAFTFEITVPNGLEAIANGVLKKEDTHEGRGDERAGWTTWTWDAKEPMATYLAGMAIGQFEIRSYKRHGIKYWDAIDVDLMADTAPPITAIDGQQFLYSQVGEPAYKRLTHTIAVPDGGGNVSFWVNRYTESGWDFLFVEAHTSDGDWTTLPDANGNTSQDTGACPGFLSANPFLEHYLTAPTSETDPCTPIGSTGEWHAASGLGSEWEEWSIDLTGYSGRDVEVSITYASDEAVQLRGVAIDKVVVSTGEGTTSFEADGDPLDGWVPAEPPLGSANPNTWAVVSTPVPAVPGPGASALVSFDRQPEILDFLADLFGKYPFAASGGIVDDEANLFFALENQTRPIYSQWFFGGPEGNDFVVVHELAHQWYGDNLAVDTWQHIWLNEGFATYAEWLWSEREGLGTAQEIYTFWAELPADDPFWELAIGDPGPDHLFDFAVYVRGAMTLQALRLEVGDEDFFKILREWAKREAGGNVTTGGFIQLAERISHHDLDALFEMWLTSGKPAESGAALRSANPVQDMPAAVRSLLARWSDRPKLPY